MSEARAPLRVGRVVVWSSLRMRKDGVDGRRGRPFGEVMMRRLVFAEMVLSLG